MSPKDSTKETLNVSILGRNYTLLCTPDEKATLLAAVALVDKKMSTIHQQMSMSGHDKIAVFAFHFLCTVALPLRKSDLSIKSSCNSEKL